MAGELCIRFLATATMSLAACVQQPSHQCVDALEQYATTFAPGEARALASSVEVTAQKFEVCSRDNLRITGAEDSRQVSLRLVDAGEWQGVPQIVIRADRGSEALTDEQLAIALRSGVAAADAEIVAARDYVFLRLFDVELLASSRHVGWMHITLDFYGQNSSTRAVVAARDSILGKPAFRHTGGD